MHDVTRVLTHCDNVLKHVRITAMSGSVFVHPSYTSELIRGGGAMKRSSCAAGLDDEPEEHGIYWSAPRMMRAPRMTLNVFMLSGEHCCDIIVTPWTMIMRVKLDIASMKDYSPYRMQLVIHGIVCENQRPVSRYTNTQTTRVTLVMHGEGIGGEGSSGSSHQHGHVDDAGQHGHVDHEHGHGEGEGGGDREHGHGGGGGQHGYADAGDHGHHADDEARHGHADGGAQHGYADADDHGHARDVPHAGPGAPPDNEE